MTPAQLITECKAKLEALHKMIPLKEHGDRVSEIDGIISSSGVWSDQKRAAALLKERKELAELIECMKRFDDAVEFYGEYLKETNDVDDVGKEIEKLHLDIGRIEFREMMGKIPNAKLSSLIQITAGAGGYDAASFAQQLLRMYSRWAINNGFKVEIIDLKESEDHSTKCIDSATIRIEGDWAYAHTISESGVHRIIRNSEFNSAGLRQTSFAAVKVMPDIEDEIEIDIKESDLEIIAQRGSNPGGQNSNKVSSCIRMIHKPTGISVFAQSERDQLQNKKMAFKLLKAKLYNKQIEEKNAERDKLNQSLTKNSFSSQIRTYTTDPYELAKDHRTGVEVRDVESVLDGDIDLFIDSYLKYSI